MTEKECIGDLYQALGIPDEGEFSCEDVVLIFYNVFHLPATTDEVHTAIQKVVGDDAGWSCVGENILDVLLEMERERARKEELYWDLQLLNAGKLNALYMGDADEAFGHQRKGWAGRSGHKQRDTCLWQLRRASRQRWARLAAEGVYSILSHPQPRQGPKVRGQAWGCVSLSDLLLLIDVKYDVVTRLLYTEMLQEHYGLTTWETLLPLQQDKAEEELEGLAMGALESGDMLGLAELPGAFRIYREPSWSAVSLLSALHTSRQQEKDALTDLSKRLDGDTLRLSSLYIRLATFRARREQTSYGALLAATQSWETWPCVVSPCKQECAALWLQGEEKGEEEEEFINSASPQQDMLYLLVLSQDREIKYLLRLLHGVSLEELQVPDGQGPKKEDKQEKAAFRDGCVRRLRQIHATRQTHNQTRIQPEQSSPLHKAQAKPQPPPGFTRTQRDACVLVLLRELMELQEARVSAVLPELLDMSAGRLQALRDECQAELQEQRLTGLLQLLTSDPPLTPNPSLIAEPLVAQNSSTGPGTPNASGKGFQGEQLVHSRSRPLPARVRTEPNVVQTVAGSESQDQYTADCGAPPEDLPYLEILCESCTTNPIGGRGRQEEPEAGGVRKTTQSYEKQDSLITLAWSKPPGEATDHDIEAAVRSTAEDSGETDPGRPGTRCEETPRDSREEVSDTPLVTCDSRSDTRMEAADRRHSTAEQRERDTQGETLIPEELEETKSPPDCDLKTRGLVAGTPAGAQTNPLAYSLELNQHVDSPCPDLTSARDDLGEAMGEVRVEVDPHLTESETWDLREPWTPRPEDHEDTSQVTGDSELTRREATGESTMMERGGTREPVSVMERERTMRCLVDMQRKVEQKQQRDRERQLLRVQERLSIIQNRKAEEDLLGVTQRDRLRQLMHNLPQEDKSQQKTVVRERLEQLRRERSYVLQSKRDRNTSGFKELLGPVALHSAEAEDGAD